jgi:hypothetical protein
MEVRKRRNDNAVRGRLVTVDIECELELDHQRQVAVQWPMDQRAGAGLHLGGAGNGSR